MGWASGTDVFVAVARAVFNSKLEGPSEDRILIETAIALYERDWDTEDEAIDRFKGRERAVVKRVLAAAYEETTCYDQ